MTGFRRGIPCRRRSASISRSGSPGISTGSPPNCFHRSRIEISGARDFDEVLLGKLIRDHLGATQNQLNRIIPGYAVSGERLATGGASSVDGTQIIGEPNIV